MECVAEMVKSQEDRALPQMGWVVMRRNCSGIQTGEGGPAEWEPLQAAGRGLEKQRGERRDNVSRLAEGPASSWSWNFRVCS